MSHGSAAAALSSLSELVLLLMELGLGLLQDRAAGGEQH